MEPKQGYQTDSNGGGTQPVMEGSPAFFSQTNPTSNNGHFPNYGASVGQPGQTANNGGIQNPGFSDQHSYIPMTGVQNGLARPAPVGPGVVTETEPQTQYALALSTVCAILCFLSCGLAAIGVSWKARLQVLDGKYRQARHSLTVAYIMNCVALFFGIIIWGLVIWFFTVIIRP